MSWTRNDSEATGFYQTQNSLRNKDQVPLGITLSDYLNKRRPAQILSSKTVYEDLSDKSPEAVSFEFLQKAPRDGPHSVVVQQRQPAQSPYGTAILHVCRGLLRQCTYLPDAAARKYLHKYIISRFRKTSTHDVSSNKSKKASNLKTARKALLYLQRANAGHRQQLTKILEITYGRVGKRRHELLEVLKTPRNTDITQKATDSPSPLPPKDISDITPQFAALIRSQAKRKATLSSRQPLKQIRPVIPETNAWSRPMPVKRVRNMKKRWYAETLDRTAPPLPMEEWQSLQRLASGEQHWDRPVMRRRRQAGSGSDEDDPGMKTHFTDRGAISRPHAITPRMMRRLWGSILAQCPAMRRKEANVEEWEVLWADVQKDRGVGVNVRGEGRMAMFAGVDEKGKIVR
ncbi:MAG: hypothetical protein Q9164_007413 [Protoblastenia rupestris]